MHAIRRLEILGRYLTAVIKPSTLGLVAWLTCSVSFAENIYFAQVADGGGFSTEFALVNIGTSASAGTLKFLNSDGTPRQVQINGVTQSEFTVRIPTGGSVRLRTGNVGGATAGWAVFEGSGGGTGGVATFDLRGAGRSLVTTAAVLGGKAYRMVSIPVQTDSSTNTGVAIASASGSAPNTVKLHLFNDVGIEVASVLDPRLNPLGSQKQVADFVTALFSSVAGINNFRGALVIEVLGGAGVAATGLTLKEGLLSALPVIELPALPVEPPLAPDYGY